MIGTVGHIYASSKRISTLDVVGATPRPVVALTAKAEVIHEVMVSGTVVDTTAVPSALLKHTKSKP